VTNNYVRNGGDGYKMFRDGLNAYDYGPGLEVVLAEFMAAQGSYEPYLDGRISVK
jgi:5'-nucleotidase